MDKQITSGLRALFVTHGIVGLVIGLGELLFPDALAQLYGMELPDPFLMRLAGAAIVGFTATSWLAVAAKEWQEVRIIVLAEIVWPALATLVMLWAVLSGAWPATAWLNVALMAFFTLGFGYFYFYEVNVVVPRLRMSPR